MADLKIANSINPNLKILVIEDMENLRAQMISDLISLGFNPETIASAEDLGHAVGEIKKRIPELIISDWNLPDGIGFDLLVKIKKTPALAHIPFILCTTIDDINNILKAINAGASEYIVKPWQIEELKKKIEITMAKINK